MMTSTALDSVSTVTSTNLSPLRRKSICPQGPVTPTLLENNDEVERRERRHEITRKSLAPKDPSGNSRRASLGLDFLAHISVPQMKERITQCIQLNAENKINIKNAFSLELIDFMTYMIKKQDSSISSLQVASSTLDVSTKIYGFRVDRVYNEILKLNAGTDKQQEDGRNEEAEAGGDQDSQEDSNYKQGKKRKRRSKQKILASHNALKGKIETCKPSLLMVRQEAQTSDLLSLAMLPNHATSGYNLHAFNDVIVDSMDYTEILEEGNGTSIPKIENFSDLSICPPLSAFQFHDNCANGDDSENEANNEDEQFQFDLDAEVPPDDESPSYNINYLDVDTEDESPAVPQAQSQEVRNIVDLREIVSATSSSTRSEYTFIQKDLNIHWAGPSHWRARNLKVFGTSNFSAVETCQQRPVRKRKNIEICYTPEKMEDVLKKFVEGQVVHLQYKSAKANWTEETTLLPRDVHYDITHANKLYLHRLLTVCMQSDDLNTTHLSDDALYDYNNENDISNYCPNVAGEDYELVDEQNDEQDIQSALTGKNLVAAPKLANKLSVIYSSQSKKIDMRQLKKSIWKNLVAHNDKENQMQELQDDLQCKEMKEPKHFSEVFKAVPLMLTKANADALSLPISFVSLLHLANEKCLKIDTLPDMSDIIVSGN